MKCRKMIVVASSLITLLLLAEGVFAAQGFTKQPACALTAQSVMKQTKSISQTAPPVSAAPTAAVSGFIGEARAKNIALTHAGFAENEVRRLRVEFDYDDGRAEYDVEFDVGQIEYSYEIDAVNGNILSYEAEMDD